MAIAQDAFFILVDIVTGLETGLYRRIGSVVRYGTGSNKDNHIELTEEELYISNNENKDTIINLQTYLKAQKRIFEEVA